MDDLQRAVAWLEEMKALAEQTIEESKKLPYAVNNIRHYKRIANCRTLLDALRKEPVEIVLDHEGLKARPLDALRWIPVSERMPTLADCFEIGRSKELCIVVLRDGFTDYLDPDIHYVRDFESLAEYFEDAGITHWRPLPTPPEGSET